MSLLNIPFDSLSFLFLFWLIAQELVDLGMEKKSGLMIFCVEDGRCFFVFVLN